jgi:hypothetical protein
VKRVRCSEEFEECLCPCHRQITGIKHILPCCEGVCHSCKKWFKKGLCAHKRGCKTES